MEAVGIIIVSVISYFIGKLFFALVGNEKGCLTNIIWGVLLIAVILTGHPLWIGLYIVGSIFIFGR